MELLSKVKLEKKNGEIQYQAIRKVSATVFDSLLLTFYNTSVGCQQVFIQ